MVSPTKNARAQTIVSSAALALLALLAGGCSAGPNIEADSAIYDGLDDNVVREVLNNAVARGKIESMPEADRESMGQAIVRNFIQCRAALDAYEYWLTTGQRPVMAPITTPTNPIEPGNETTILSQDAIDIAIESGEPTQLKDFLVGEARCGEWIPATPGDPSGPTIEDRALELG